MSRVEVVTAGGVRSQLIVGGEREGLIGDRWLRSGSIEETEILHFAPIHLSDPEDQRLMVRGLIVVEKDSGDVLLVQI